MFLAEAELPILYWIQELRSPFLDACMEFVTSLGDKGLFFILLGAVLLLFPRTRRTGAAVLLSLTAGFLVGNLFLKNAFMRQRPCWLDPAVVLLIETPSDYSFPSGHSLASFETAVSIFLYHKKWGTAAILLAVLIAFSRLYLFVHFPTDVAAGAVLGSLIAWMIHRILEKQKNCVILKRQKNKRE